MSAKHWADFGPDRTPLAPEFIQEIELLAEHAGKAPAEVYLLWKDYARRCEWSDQSPLLPEFKEWYKLELTPKVTYVQRCD